MDLPLATEVYKKIPKSSLEKLHKKTIFLTGGTGFIGKWLLHLFQWIKETQEIQFKLIVLTRSPDSFIEKHPELASDFEFVEGDVRNPCGLFCSEVDYVIHGATSTDASLNKKDPLFCFETVIQGTKNILNLAKDSGAKKFLLLSSGAVYGRQNLEVSHQEESNTCSLDINNPNYVYHESKRAAEMLCSVYGEQFGICVNAARCYAFVGPYLPIDQHFAVGNFIKNSIAGEKILIKGDGTALRSYMYPSDLVAWLLTILLEGEPNRAYNVGSEESLSILQLAHLVKEAQSEAYRELGLEPRDLQIEVLGTPSGEKPERYVPSTKLGRESLNLGLSVSAAHGIKETIKWHLTQYEKREI